MYLIRFRPLYFQYITVSYFKTSQSRLSINILIVVSFRTHHHIMWIHLEDIKFRGQDHFLVCGRFTMVYPKMAKIAVWQIMNFPSIVYILQYTVNYSRKKKLNIHEKRKYRWKHSLGRILKVILNQFFFELRLSHSHLIHDTSVSIDHIYIMYVSISTSSSLISFVLSTSPHS